MLDNWAKSPAGLLVPRAEFDAAYKDATGNRTVVVVVGEGSAPNAEMIKDAVQTPTEPKGLQQGKARLLNGTGFPAVTFPAGFSAPGASAPRGVPVGGELLGLDYSEDKLLSYAYAFEQAAKLRKAPASTPPLPHEP